MDKSRELEDFPEESRVYGSFYTFFILSACWKNVLFFINIC